MRIALGIPTIGSVAGEVYGSHLVLAVEIGRVGEVVIVTPQDVFPVDRARELIVDECEKHEVDYLLSIDSDMFIPYGTFSFLLEIMLRRKVQVVSGKYYQREYPYANVWGKLVGEGSYHVDADKGEHEVDGVGLGIALIDFRWVMANLERPFFKIAKSEGSMIIWEDYYFCHKVMEAGGVVLGTANLVAGHLTRRKLVDDLSVEYYRTHDALMMRQQAVDKGD